MEAEATWGVAGSGQFGSGAPPNDGDAFASARSSSSPSAPFCASAQGPETNSGGTDTRKESAQDTQTTQPAPANATAENAFSFKEDLTSDWCLAVSRVDSGRTLLERLRAALLLRANAAVEQASKMESLVQTFVATNLESKTVMSAVNALRLEAVHQADHCREFAEAIRRDVVEGTLTNTIHNHYLVLQQIKADGSEAQKELTLATVDHQKAMHRYLRCSKEAAAAAVKAQAAEGEAPNVRTELALSAIRRCVEAKAAEDEHRESVARLNAAAQANERKMAIILQSLQDMDEKRMLCFRDALRKAMVYQAAYLRNVQYDLEQTIKTVDAVDPMADLQEFLGKYRLPKKQTGADVKVQSWVELDNTFGDALQPSASVTPVPWAPGSTPAHGSSGSSAFPTSFAASPFSSSPLGVSSLGVSSAAAAASNVARSFLQKSPFTRVMQSAASLVAGRGPASESGVHTPQGPEAAAGESLAAEDQRPQGGGGGSASGAGRSEEKRGRREEKTSFFALITRSEEQDLPANAESGDEAKVRSEREFDALLDLLWSEAEPAEKRNGAGDVETEGRPVTAFVVDPAQCPYSPEVRHQLDAALPRLKSDFASPAKRLAFLKAVERRRRACMVRGHKQVYLHHMLCLRILGEISEWLLDAADEQLDVWTGRMLLLLSMQIAASGLKSADPQMQTFSWVDFAQSCAEIDKKDRGDARNTLPATEAETVRWSLHRCIYHHRYWNRVTFWEEALTLTISEEFQRQKLMEKWRTMGDEVLQQEEKAFRERNPCCGCLTSFGSFMVLYGIAPEQVQSLLLVVCRACHLEDEFAARLVEGMQQFASPTVNANKASGSSSSAASSSSSVSSSSCPPSSSSDPPSSSLPSGSDSSSRKVMGSLESPGEAAREAGVSSPETEMRLRAPAERGGDSCSPRAGSFEEREQKREDERLSEAKEVNTPGEGREEKEERQIHDGQENDETLQKRKDSERIGSF
ncbi:hypothetical protein TGP89_259720 [Toxoplasma gondii p89]|uniref:Uncharacterized protein n=1 Tax=Toxoplasma gondii p89 TaxID=943119 RepID=A0A086K738_TOXGO|nr:hypothetical protein TGP89_259720 [Toxoplasma gondii p89]